MENLKIELLFSSCDKNSFDNFLLNHNDISQEQRELIMDVLCEYTGSLSEANYAVVDPDETRGIVTFITGVDYENALVEKEHYDARYDIECEIRKIT